MGKDVKDQMKVRYQPHKHVSFGVIKKRWVLLCENCGANEILPRQPRPTLGSAKLVVDRFIGEHEKCKKK